MKKSIIVMSVTLVLVLVVLLAYVVAFYKLHAFAGALLTEQETVQRAQFADQNQVELRRVLPEIEAARNELNQYLIGQEEVVGFLELIEALGRAQGATVSTASLNVVPNDARTEDLHVTIKATGSLRAVQHVLSLLEVLPYKSYVASAAINKKSTVADVAEWEGTFEVVVTKHTGQ